MLWGIGSHSANRYCAIRNTDWEMCFAAIFLHEADQREDCSNRNMHVCDSSLPVLLAHIPAGFSQVKQMEAQALGSLVIT